MLEQIKWSNSSFKGMGCFGGSFGLVWLLFWTAITGAFDVLWLGMAGRQAASWTYAATTGTIVESSLERNTDSDGDATYDANVKYEYLAAGHQLQGSRIRHLEFRMGSGRQDAEYITARFPAGKQVPVYFSPREPGIAVLDRGFRGADFFLPLFMLPFNGIMLGGWYALGSMWRKRRRPGGLRWRDDGLKVVVRLYNVTPLVAAVAAAMISSFVLIFVCGFGMIAVPLDWLVSGSWLVVLGSGAWAFARFRRPAATLEYDHFSARITITKSDGQSHTFAAQDILAFDSRTLKPGAKNRVTGEEGERAATYSPTITYRGADGDQREVQLANWSSQEDVAWLVRWLRETLRLKA